MKRLLREPLLHFLVLGGALFLAFALFGKRADGGSREIRITRGQIDALAAGFKRTWLRPPTAEELDGLIEDRVREEVYDREAIALGLDKDDAIIRRRLRQKMELISGDAATQAEPTEDELRSYLSAHADVFRLPPRFTFRQAGFDPKRGQSAPASEQHFDGIPQSEVVKRFGALFAARLNELPPGRWEGPIPSDLGPQLVFLTARIEGGAPRLDDVRDRARQEWANAKRLEASEAFYGKLRDKYAVNIERP